MGHSVKKTSIEVCPAWISLACHKVSPPRATNVPENWHKFLYVLLSSVQMHLRSWRLHKRWEHVCWRPWTLVLVACRSLPSGQWTLPRKSQSRGSWETHSLGPWRPCRGRSVCDCGGRHSYSARGSGDPSWGCNCCRRCSDGFGAVLVGYISCI